MLPHFPPATASIPRPIDEFCSMPMRMPLHAKRAPTTILLLATLLQLVIAQVEAFADTVTVKSRDGKERRITGEIVDYSGNRLVIKLASGRDEEFSAESM